MMRVQEWNRASFCDALFAVTERFPEIYAPVLRKIEQLVVVAVFLSVALNTTKRPCTRRSFRVIGHTVEEFYKIKGTNFDRSSWPSEVSHFYHIGLLSS